MSEHCCNHEKSTACKPPVLVFPTNKASDIGNAKNACCSGGVPVFDGVDPRYRRILWTVIAINGAMFFIEMIAGQLAGSQALKADALDFLADTVTYGLSLAVIGASLRTRATVALFKGGSLVAMALWVFGSTLYQVLVLGLPSADVMGVIGFSALAANLGSVLLLRRYKDGDANVRSVWLCSRNDAIGNVVVMVAALGVWGTSSAWPDLAVAALMAGIFLSSSIQILRQAWAEYIEGSNPQSGAALRSKFPDTEALSALGDRAHFLGGVRNEPGQHRRSSGRSEALAVSSRRLKASRMHLQKAEKVSG